MIKLKNNQFFFVMCFIGICAQPLLAQKIYWDTYNSGSGIGKIQRANLYGFQIEDVIVFESNFPQDLAIDAANGKIYWTGGTFTGGVFRSDINGSNIEQIITWLYPNGITLDRISEKIYWTYSFDWDSGIQRANFDGTEIEKVVFTSTDTPLGIALDPINSKIYWTQLGSKRILRADLDGSNIEELVTGLDRPAEIALDLVNQKMYWCDSDTNKIQRANMDGGDVEDLVTTGLSSPWGITLDVENNRMYWADVFNNRIQRANLDGSNREDFITGLSRPASIQLDLLSPNIPTLSEWGVIVMAILITGAATVILRRRPYVHPKANGTARLAVIFTCIVSCQVIAEWEDEPYIQISTNELISDSGIVSASGSGSDPVVIYSEIISVPDALWMRIHFQEVVLSGSPSQNNESFIRLTSLLDNDVQIISSSGLLHWKNSSAYFNGDQVLVELLSYPNTGDNSLITDKATTGVIDQGGGSVVGICGDIDDRTPSTDKRAARLRFARTGNCDQETWCSAFLISNHANGFLTAGHCCDEIHYGCDNSPVVEFNVRNSTSEGYLIPSPIAYQFAIDEDSVQLLNLNYPYGQDWCYFGVWRNEPNQGEYITPIQKQHTSYKLADIVPDPSIPDTLRITGYGLVNLFDPEANKLNGTQQTAAGPYIGVDGTILKHRVDTQGGNSGSPIEHVCGEVYGILTHGECYGDTGENFGTAIDHDSSTHASLKDALNDPWGVLADCNENSVLDTVEIANGTSQDCNSNNVPDECESTKDCNNNGRDLCENFTDCNHNSVPDECDLDSGFSKNCNNNDIPDECDICSGVSLDCNWNYIPDECESPDDCQLNGIQDICDIAMNTSEDCNLNNTPDECDLSSGTSFDCNSNGLPDECESEDDCNNNSIQDFCDIATGSSLDCNTNSIPDECDIAGPTSDDCNTNTIPDECESQNDCQPNGILDICDLFSGTSQDCNNNLIPDECEYGACCLLDESCTTTTDCNCSTSGGYFNSYGSDCYSLGGKGACCVDGLCVDPKTECVCNAISGTFLGELSTCASQASGACCFGSTCQSNTTQCDCINGGGNYQGDGSKCIGPQCQQYGPQGP